VSGAPYTTGGSDGNWRRQLIPAWLSWPCWASVITPDGTTPVVPRRVVSKPAGAFHNPPAGVLRSDLMPDGRTLFVLSPQGIQWWDTTHPVRPARADSSALPLASSTGSVTSTGSILAAAVYDRDYSTCDCYDLSLYGVSGGRVTASASLSRSAGEQLARSEDGHLLAAAGAGDNGLTLWTTATQDHPVREASLATVPALAGITIGDNDTRLADWSGDHLQLWDITNPANPELLASVSFSLQPDSNQLSASVASAMFDPSGPELAVIFDSTLAVVDADPTALARQYCADTSPVTKAEWARYASNVPYQSPCSRE
jgi:hypothetical protein